MVLHHDTVPVTILSTANEDGPTIRRFIRDNPVVQDGINISPPRNYHETDSWLFAPNNGTVSPTSSHSSSFGYFRGAIGRLTRLGSHTTLWYKPFSNRFFQRRSGRFLHFLPYWTSLKKPGDCRDPRGVMECKQQEERLRREARKSTRVGQKCHDKHKRENQQTA